MRDSKPQPEKRPSMQQSTRREIEATEMGGHPAFTMGGVAPVRTVTDHWVIPQPNPDASDLDSLPSALADALDGGDHHGDRARPDHVGEVLDSAAAEANHPGLHPATADGEGDAMERRLVPANGETRSTPRHGASAIGVVICPRCGSPSAEAFSDGDTTNFRCNACHGRSLFVMGVMAAVPD